MAPPMCCLLQNTCQGPEGHANLSGVFAVLGRIVSYQLLLGSAGAQQIEMGHLLSEQPDIWAFDDLLAP